MTAGCEGLRKATGGCRVVLLAATDLEAGPLRAALGSPREYRIATKAVSIGELPSGNADGMVTPGVRTALAVSGCDKANAALTLTALLQVMSPAPELVLQVGIAGGFAPVGPGPAARPGDLVLATQEAYSDTGSSGPAGWSSAKDLGLPIAQMHGAELGGVFPFDPRLVEWAAGVLQAAGFRGGDGGAPAVLAGPFVTSSMVTGTDEEARVLAERWGAVAESMEGAAAAHVCALFGVPFLELRSISNVVGERDRSKWLVGQAVEAARLGALALLAALAQKTGARYV